MPEGDTIHRTANRLRPALVGGHLQRFEAPRASGRRPEAGSEVEAVDAVGKHLLVRFGGGVVLRTHLGMTGSWHLYRAQERWQRSRSALSALVEVETWVAVCFSAPVVSLAPVDLSHLGPDLTRADLLAADLDTAAQRLASVGDRQIKPALLDQRVAAGIGNVYASEVLWLHRVNPFTAVRDLGPDVQHALLAAAAALLRRNTAGAGPRVTYRGGVAVYRRAGRPCPRCGTGVRSARQGDPPRGTWWCPQCQPA